MKGAGVFCDTCGDCPPASPPPASPPPASPPPASPPPASVGVDADGLGPIFIALGNGSVIRGWPKEDETNSDNVVFIAR